jgi:chemotaxis protein MotB
MMGRYKFIVIGLSCFFMLSCVSKTKYTELESDLMNTQNQVKEGDQTIGSLEQELKQSKEIIELLKTKLMGSNEKNAVLEENLSATEAKLYDLQENYNGLQDELRQNRSMVEDQKSRLIETDQEKKRLEGELRQSRSVIEDQKSRLEETNEAKKSLEMTLKDQINAQQIKINEMEGKLQVTFIDKILFNSGSARVNKKGMELLDKMASSLKELEDQNIAVEGHTDNVPIGAILKDRYPTNWDLSTARAVAVVRFLIENAEMNPELFSAIGYGENRPIATNDTEEGRSQNRRIEIILIPIK